jgi:hypothetical protein
MGVTRLIVLGLSLLAADVGDELPEELAPFVPQGHEALDFAVGDLDGDGRTDAVLILTAAGEVEKQDDMDDKRPLLLLIRQADGRLKQARRSDNVVYCRTCGGAMGDPYAGMDVGPGRFTVKHYGGSASRWANSYTFAYDTARKDWFLDGDTSVSFHASDPDATRDETTLTREELGDVPLEAFTAGYDKANPWRVVAARAFFYDSPRVASKPRKAYLVKGDVFEGYRELRHFVHGQFRNRAGDSTWGYLRKADLEAVSAAP